MALGRVAGAHDPLRFHAVEVGAGVFHHAVVAGLDVLARQHGDDGMTGDPGRQRQLGHGLHHRAFPGHAVDAGRHLVAQAFRHLQPCCQLLELLGAARHQRHRQGQDVAGQFPHPVLGEEAAPVRRRNEHHALDEGQRLEEQRLTQALLEFRVGRETFERLVAERAPQLVARIDGGHVREQAALAVADDDHLLQGRVGVIGVQPVDHVGQRLPQKGGRGRHRQVAAVFIEPELVALADGRVMAQAVDHLRPPDRAAAGAMHHHHRDAATLVGLHEQHVALDILTAEKIPQPGVPERGIVQTVGQRGAVVGLQRHGLAVDRHVMIVVAGIKLQRCLPPSGRQFQQAALDAQEGGDGHGAAVGGLPRFPGHADDRHAETRRAVVGGKAEHLVVVRRVEPLQFTGFTQDGRRCQAYRQAALQQRPPASDQPQRFALA